jgi:hypothetical protein
MRCFVVPSLGKCRAHFEKAFPKIAWDIPAVSMARDARAVTPANVAGTMLPGAKPLLQTRKNGISLVESEYDDLIEPDWASDESCAMGEV